MFNSRRSFNNPSNLAVAASLAVVAWLVACGRIGYDPGSASDEPDQPDGSGVLVATSSSAGWYHTCAVDAGALYCWGDNSLGQLGLGPDSSASSTTPARVGTSTDWLLISAGEDFTCATQRGDSLWCWGTSESGRLGDGGAAGFVDEPTRIAPEFAWSTVAAGLAHACAITAQGQLYCWGQNSDGRLGIGTVGSPVRNPAEVTGNGGWTHVVTGSNFTCGIQDDSVYCWGANQEGQLGTDEPDQVIRPDPIVVPGLPGELVDIANGREHVCVVAANASLWCWGDNSQGQIGTDDAPADHNVPVQVPGQWRTVTAGEHFTCALDTENRLWCWGDNQSGQLGLGDVGSMASRSVPAQVGTSSGWQGVTAGFAHACALRRDQLACWGDNQSGQLGTGDYDSRIIPAAVRAPGTW